jgi:hypothetical protein
MFAAAMNMTASSHNALSCNYWMQVLVPEEKAVLMREQASSMYDVPPYFFAKVIAEIPFSLPTPIVIILVTYWAIPLNSSPGAFFILCITSD